MDSQTLSEWLQLQIGKHVDEPIYRQLYRLLRQGILQGRLSPGVRLPPTRLLARELSIARNTVLQVYEQLAIEGFISAATGRGTFVEDISQDLTDDIDASPHAVLTSELPPRRLSSAGVRMMASLGYSERQTGAFMPGVPDLSEFPTKHWARIQNRHWRALNPELLTYAPSGGHLPLREALTDYLEASRSVKCVSQQVVITSGIHQVIDIATRLLCDTGDRVWIEEPSYWGIRNLLLSLGMTVQSIPVDAEGINPSAKDMESPPRLIVVTPSHQYPLGMVMSLTRRRKLLEFARLNNCWVLEDDYDSDFRYGTRPLPSLQGLDGDGLVLYAGSFSKTLFPGLRLGYAVVPKTIAPAFSSLTAELFREGQLVTQSIMTEFLTEGFVGSHIRKMRGLYATRRTALLSAIHTRYGQRFPVIGDKAGLHFVLSLPDTANDVLICQIAAQRGVLARPLSKYYSNAHVACQGLVLGYACVPAAEIAEKFGVLADVINQTIVFDDTVSRPQP